MKEILIKMTDIQQKKFSLKTDPLLVKKDEKGNEYWYAISKMKEKLSVSKVEFSEDTLVEEFEKRAGKEDWQEVFIGGSFKCDPNVHVDLPLDFYDSSKVKPFKNQTEKN